MNYLRNKDDHAGSYITVNETCINRRYISLKHMTFRTTAKVDLLHHIILICNVVIDMGYAN